MSGDADDQEVKVLIHPEPTASTTYGSVLSTSSYDDEDDDDGDYGNDSFFDRSIHHVNPANVMISTRPSITCWGHRESLLEEFNIVPSKLEENMKLVVDPSLERNELGSLYYSVESYYNAEDEPQYALTVHPEVYKDMLKEVWQAKKLPCGLYFCCHGGDSAHTGDMSDDSVDISIAWYLVATILTAILFLGAIGGK